MKEYFNIKILNYSITWMAIKTKYCQEKLHFMHCPPLRKVPVCPWVESVEASTGSLPHSLATEGRCVSRGGYCLSISRQG